ncbi:hypothetical protein MPSEU_000739600 [Mayamaea pseudoterrestris]|nr:hypothetical protein MPSEU_000739600 [Mayamaea pseudoterrestris]
MPLRLNKLLGSSMHKLKQPVHDDYDDDNISLCSDMERSTHNHANMMMPLEPTDLINLQVQGKPTFQAYHCVSDYAGEDSDISDDDDSFAGDAPTQERTSTSPTVTDGTFSLFASEGNETESYYHHEASIKPAQFNPIACMENEVTGTIWIEATDDQTRHLELEILTRSEAASRHQRHQSSKSQSRKSRSSRDKNSCNDGNEASTLLDNGSRHSRRTSHTASSRLERIANSQNNKNNDESDKDNMTSSRSRRSRVKRTKSTDDTLTCAGNELQSSGSSHHRQQPSRDFEHRRTKSSQCINLGTAVSVPCETVGI